MANVKKNLAEVPPPGADKETHPEPDGDEGQDKVMAALAGIEKRLAALENPDKEEKLAEDEPVKKDEDETEEKMATMAAKVCSIMLAKVGVQPRGSKPVVEDEKTDGMSAEEVKLCASLKMDDTERKQFAANLARAKTVRL